MVLDARAVPPYWDSPDWEAWVPFEALSGKAHPTWLHEETAFPSDTTCGQDLVNPHRVLALLHEEIDNLPEAYRDPIILFHLVGESVEEVAETTCCSIPLVEFRLRNGLEKLSARLGHLGEHTPPDLVGRLLTLEQTAPEPFTCTCEDLTRLSALMSAESLELTQPEILALKILRKLRADARRDARGPHDLGSSRRDG